MKSGPDTHFISKPISMAWHGPWSSNLCLLFMKNCLEMKQQHSVIDTQVASYPFDDSRFHKKTSWLSADSGIYSASPDDALFRLVSSLYANGHPHMSSGDNCDLQGSPKLGSVGYPVHI